VCVCVCVKRFCETEGKYIKEKEEWGERDRQKKERKRACGREGEAEKEESEVVSGGGGRWSVEMSVAH